ncbi:MAG TPA: glycoside hydrolase family 3 C-terminal domain-containing protein [Pyrinomonadaceae bacterium]
MKKLQAIVLAYVLSFAVMPVFGQSAGNSNDVEARVNSLLSQLTLEEKIDLLAGVDGFYIRDVPRLKIPRLKMADGPIGVRNFGPATAMAAGVGLAATWNPTLAEIVGTEIGRDARAKGVNFMLGPGVNIFRAPMNGRNFEYFGEDPFLASRIAVGYVKGIQSQGVSATIKHFMGNNSEYDRHNTDSIIDERAMREIYLPVFEAAVKEAHVGAVMSSYNLTNGTHMSQNKYLLTDVLKNEWKFDGLVMSDWGGTYDGVGAANGGQDLEMPGPAHMNRKELMPAIEKGEVSAATIDDKIRRILRTAIRFGWLDREQTDYSIPRYNQAGREAALNAARESLVLLKNDGNLLPLTKGKTKSVLVVGPDAYPAVPVGGGSARVEPFSAVGFLEGLSNYLGSQTQVYYSRGVQNYSDLADATAFMTATTNGEQGFKAEYFSSSDLQGQPTVTRVERRMNFGTGSRLVIPPDTGSSRWTGYYTPQNAGPHDLFVQTSGEGTGAFRVYVDDKLTIDNWSDYKSLVNYVTLSLDATPHKVVLERKGRTGPFGSRTRLGIVRQGQFVSEDAKKLAAKVDVIVVAAGYDQETESEGADRTFALPPGQDELIKEMSTANKNTVVVVTAGGGVDMNAWVDHVPALVQAWYPGQQGGTALAEVLFGEVNPSGRLPVSFERRWEDNPVHDSYYTDPGTRKVNYKEGIFVGYRGYERAKTKPLFAFGSGLSYTTFKYSDLSVKPTGNGSFEVSFAVRNTGTREGADVPQVYVSAAPGKVERPVKELKGFSKVSLKAGESKRVTVMLDGRSLSYYDVEAKQWRAEPGTFSVLVGHSSDQIELNGKLTLTSAIASK